MIRGYGPRKPKQKRKVTRVEIPFQRVSAEIKVDSNGEINESRVILNDLTPLGVGCFINVPLDKGEMVSIVIEQPKHLFLKGQVEWCKPYTLDTKIISEENFRYRIGIKFVFDTPEEAAEVKKYWEELHAPTAKESASR